MERGEDDAWEGLFWTRLEDSFPSLEQAFAFFRGRSGPGGSGGATVSFAEFDAAVEAGMGGSGEALLPKGQARNVFESLCLLQAAAGARTLDLCFSEGDMVRSHSSWRKRMATRTHSVLDHAIHIPEPDALAKANDVRLPHQFLKKEDVHPPTGKNVKWYYPQPSMEMEARRVLDFWRGLASRPWGSKQEAAQHFRRAFAFLDTLGSGRVNYDTFKSGVVRLRYGLPEVFVFIHLVQHGGRCWNSACYVNMHECTCIYVHAYIYQCIHTQVLTEFGTTYTQTHT